MRYIALFISYLLHPAVMPLLGFALLVHLHPWPMNTSVLIYTYTFIFAGTYLLPAFISVLFKYMGLIPSLHMENADDRRWPFVIGFLFYLFTAIYLRSFPVPMETGRFLMGAAMSIGILTVLLPYTKASAHMAGVGGIVGLIWYMSEAYYVDLFSFWIIAILATGLVASARLYLKAHSPIEIVLGLTAGITGALVSLKIL